MLKNITLSAKEDLIERARKRAAGKNTTLNAEFRRWLEQYADGPHSAVELKEFLIQFEHVNPGKTFTREEMNER